MADQRDAAAKAARELTDALEGVAERLGAVRDSSEKRDAELLQYGRRNRHLIRILLVSLVLDLALTVAVGALSIQARDNATAIAKASASNLALCEAGNIARHQQIQLWEFVLHLPHPKRQTVRQKRNLAEFQVHLAKIFAPRNCTHLHPPASPPPPTPAISHMAQQRMRDYLWESPQSK